MDWQNLTRAVRKMLDSERLTYGLMVDSHKRNRAIIGDRKTTLDDPDCPDELRGLWLEWEAVVRQEKALWLRQVLDDYEF
jgi:hypothetical protein